MGSSFSSRRGRHRLLAPPLFVLMLAVAILAQPPEGVSGASVLVTSADDAGGGTLRQAMLDLAGPEEHTITFDVSDVTIAFGSPITIGSGQHVIIDGTGQAITLDGGNLDGDGESLGTGVQLFRVDPGGTLELRGLTLTGGYGDNGGAIENAGTLTIRESFLSGNYAAVHGGTVFNTGTLTVIGSTITANSTLAGWHQPSGGGIYSQDGTVTIEDSVLSENAAPDGYGGGLYVKDGTAEVTDSQVHSNEAYRGGGGIAVVDVTLTISGTSIRDNVVQGVDDWSGPGGGLYAQNTHVTVADSTLAGNAVPFSGGGAIYVHTNSGTGSFTMTGSMVGGPSAADANSAQYLGGLFIIDVDGRIEDSSIMGNRATESGAGVWQGGDATITSTRIVGNSAVDWCGGLSLEVGTYRVEGGTLITGNTLVTGDPSAVGAGGLCGGDASVTIVDSAIYGNLKDGAPADLYMWSGTVTASGNWWGAPSGPVAGTLHGDDITFAPWLQQLTLSADPASPADDEQATLTARLLDSTGASAGDGLVVRFTGPGATAEEPLSGGAASIEVTGSQVAGHTATVLFAGTPSTLTRTFSAGGISNGTNGTDGPGAGPSTARTRDGLAVLDRQQRVVADGTATSVTSSSPDGGRVQVDAPAGALPAGSTLTAAAIGDISDLVGRFPPPPSAFLAAAFVVEAQDAAGRPITGGFGAPITLEFTVPPSSAPEATPGAEIVLAFWNGTDWVEVKATVEVGPDGSLTVSATVDHFTVFSVFHQPGRGTFSPVPNVGVTLSVWRGGGYDLLDAALAEGGSAWTYVGGNAVGYTARVPAWVNQAFRALHPEGVPAGTLLIVHRKRRP